MSVPMIATGFSGGAVAAIVAVPVLGYLAWKYLFDKEPGEAAVAEASAAYTHPGPRGERVFNHDAAQGILRALPGMGYSHPHPGNYHLVEIHPERGGAPPHASLSAANWLRTQNRRMSVMAPVYLPMPTGATRYLRLAPPGHEADLAEHGYAVLAYAQAHHRPTPGQPITGRPPTTAQRSEPIPTPVSQAYAELPSALHDQLTKILKNPVRPAQGHALANDFARSGLQATASIVSTKASNAASQEALGMPQTPSLLPVGWTAPVALVQSLLKTIGVPGADRKPLVIDGKLGENTASAVRAFQRAHGLAESGAVDGPTLVALNNAAAPHAQSQMQATDAAHPGTTAVSPHVRAPTGQSWWGGGAPTASAGGWFLPALGGAALKANQQAGATTGAAVIALATPSPPVQRALALLSLPPTYAGLKQFQQAYGLPITGLIDAGTWTALQNAVAQTTGQTVSGNDSDALTVQQYLVRLNLLPFFAMTGRFDELTRRAIRSFQSARKLPANGVLDPRTAALLEAAAQNLPDPMASGNIPFVPRQNIQPWS